MSDINRPSAETIEILTWIVIEIVAGKSFSNDHDAEIWNNASDRALSIVRSYREGLGLFQMTVGVPEKSGVVRE